jgi:outer membrane lipoprotein-sorting protein
MRVVKVATITIAGSLLAWPQTGELKTAQAVLARYQRAIGGVEAIQKVQSETRHGEVEQTGMSRKITFVAYAKPFKTLQKVALPDGEAVSGFDGSVSWTINPQGPQIDRSTPLEAVRRDADLQYSLHQPDYFQTYELKGVTDFDGRPCYWMHGITNWGKDNNQFYDVETGLLAGYRFQSDNSSSAVVTTLLFKDYKKSGDLLAPMKIITHTGDQTQTVTFTSISYEPLDDSLFELPPSIKVLRATPVKDGK